MADARTWLEFLKRLQALTEKKRLKWSVTKDDSPPEDNISYHYECQADGLRVRLSTKRHNLVIDGRLVVSLERQLLIPASELISAIDDVLAGRVRVDWEDKIGSKVARFLARHKAD